MSRMVIRYADGSYLPGGEFHGFPRPTGHVREPKSAEETTGFD